MPKHLNPYERRQRKREVNQITARALLIALVVAGLGYFLTTSSLNTGMYQEVLASNGTKTLDSVRTSYLFTFGICCFPITFIALAVFLAIVTPRRRKTFEFDDSMQVQPYAQAYMEPYAQPRWTHPPQPHTIKLSSLSPTQFEYLVAELIEAKGFHPRVVGGRGDGGVDIEVYGQQGTLIGIVQCKRYDPNKALPPTFVRELAAVRYRTGVKKAYLATSTYFSEQTHYEAAQLGIELVSGDDLRKMMRTRRYQSPNQWMPPNSGAQRW